MCPLGHYPSSAGTRRRRVDLESNACSPTLTRALVPKERSPRGEQTEMANDFPRTLGHARLPDIFKSIAGAGTPPKFNNECLTTTLGYTSSNDRAIIPILRKLGFISAGGEPTQRYNDF